MIEVRLIWKKPRDGKPPLPCSRRVESEAEGWERAAMLEPETFEIDVVTCSRDCGCRSGILASQAKVAEPESAAPADWKMRQAGDRN